MEQHSITKECVPTTKGFSTYECSILNNRLSMCTSNLQYLKNIVPVEICEESAFHILNKFFHS